MLQPRQGRLLFALLARLAEAFLLAPRSHSPVLSSFSSRSWSARLLVVRRALDDDDDDFSVDAFRARVEKISQQAQDDEKPDLLETAALGASSVAGSFVAIAAALAAVGLGLYLAGFNSPLKNTTPAGTAPPEEETFYLIPSNAPPPPSFIPPPLSVD